MCRFSLKLDSFIDQKEEAKKKTQDTEIQTDPIEKVKKLKTIKKKESRPR